MTQVESRHIREYIREIHIESEEFQPKVLMEEYHRRMGA